MVGRRLCCTFHKLTQAGAKALAIGAPKKKESETPMPRRSLSSLAKLEHARRMLMSGFVRGEIIGDTSLLNREHDAAQQINTDAQSASSETKSSVVPKVHNARTSESENNTHEDKQSKTLAKSSSKRKRTEESEVDEDRKAKKAKDKKAKKDKKVEKKAKTKRMSDPTEKAVSHSLEAHSAEKSDKKSKKSHDKEKKKKKEKKAKSAESEGSHKADKPKKSKSKRSSKEE